MANAKLTIFVVMGNNPAVSSTPKMVITKKLVDILIGSIPLAVTGLHPSALPHQTKAELGIEVLRGKIFDGTPDMPWDLLPMDKYIAHFWHCLDGSPRKPYASIATSLGCCFSCDFCPAHALYGNTRRMWFKPVDEVVNEIDILVNKYKVRNIKFWDELFTANKDRVGAICDKIIERGYNLNVWAYARVDTVNIQLLRKMKKAGIKWLGYGFESGSDVVLDEINKKTDRAEAIKAVEITHDAGINVGANIILGLPQDTPETMRETMDFVKDLNVEWLNVYFAEKIPGSPLWYEMPDKDKDWSRFGQFSPNQRDTEVIRFRDKAFNEFFTDPKYLANIRSKFGEQAVKQIDDMLKFGKPKTRSVDASWVGI